MSRRHFTFTMDVVADFVVGIVEDIEEEIVVGLVVHNSDILKKQMHYN